MSAHILTWVSFVPLRSHKKINNYRRQDDRLFDVSFVSRCFQKGALRRVQGAVIGGDRLIGVCRISSSELRGLGSSTVPADLKLRDPR